MKHYELRVRVWNIRVNVAKYERFRIVPGNFTLIVEGFEDVFHTNMRDNLGPLNGTVFNGSPQCGQMGWYAINRR